MRGANCMVATNMGACQSGTLQCQAGKPDLVCVTHAPSDESCNAQDDDCDGKVDETFNLQSDANNCGACGKACATGESCCAGRCANPQNDVNNCGGCARVCASGARPGCCSGSCVDLLGDDNCGSCGHACGLLGGVVLPTCADQRSSSTKLHNPPRPLPLTVPVEVRPKRQLSSSVPTLRRHRGIASFPPCGRARSGANLDRNRGRRGRALPRSDACAWVPDLTAVRSAIA